MKIYQLAVSKVSGLALLALCSTNIYAASITGQVNVTGTVGVSSTAIDFYSNASQACGIGTQIPSVVSALATPKVGTLTRSLTRSC